MNIEDYIKTKKAFIIGFDNVLYPEKDYLLQVYYLFSEFITYSE
ncbi:MAG: haloacid dehalogenase, partial [Pedobacter sp.]